MTDANVQWLEFIKESFGGAVANGDYVTCKDVIQKLRDEGFEIEAKQLHNLLMEETIGTFLVEGIKEY